MLSFKYITIGLCLGIAIAQDSDGFAPDTPRNDGADTGPTDKGNIYSINILPLVRPSGPGGIQGQESNDVDPAVSSGKVPALFFFQRVNSDGRLPDGIYYRPPEGEGTPPPVLQKEITNVQAFALAPDVYRPLRA